jgi:hypothetical protein
MVLVEIIPNLWVSNVLKVNTELYQIKCFINTDKDIGKLELHQKYNHELRDRMLKYELTKKTEYYKECISYIDKHIDKNGILLFSSNLQNSISIVMSYLITRGKINFNKAHEIIKTKIDKLFIINESNKNIIKNI